MLGADNDRLVVHYEVDRLYGRQGLVRVDDPADLRTREQAQAFVPRKGIRPRRMVLHGGSLLWERLLPVGLNVP